MPKCPVCKTVSEDFVCPECGFDSSRNYEDHPTCSEVTANSIAYYRQAWSVNQPHANGNAPEDGNTPVAQEQIIPQEAPAAAPTYNQIQATFAKYRICLEMVESGKADLEAVRTSFASMNRSLLSLDFDPDELLPGFSLRWSVAAEMVAKQQKAIDQEAEKQLQAQQRKQQQVQQKQQKQEQREQAKLARAAKRTASKAARQDRREDFADSIRSMFRKREPSWETIQRRQERRANTKQFFSEHGLFIIVLLFSLAATLTGIHFSVNVSLTPPVITGLGVMIYCSIFGVTISDRRSKSNLLAQVLFIVLPAAYLVIRGKYLPAFLSANLVLLIFNTERFIPRYAPSVSKRYLQVLCFGGIGTLFVAGIEMWYLPMIQVSCFNAVWFVPLFGTAIFFLLDKLTEFNLRTIGIIIALFLLRTGVILCTLCGGAMALVCYFYMFLVLLGIGIIVVICVTSMS